MLEDPTRDVVYVTMSKPLFETQQEWSDPVQWRVEMVAGEPTLVMRKLDILVGEEAWLGLEREVRRAAG